MAARLVGFDCSSSDGFPQSADLSKSTMFVSDASSSSIYFDSNQIPGMFRSIGFGSKIKRATLRIFRQCIHWRRPTGDTAVQLRKTCGKHHFPRMNDQFVGSDCFRDFVLELGKASAPSKAKSRATRPDAESEGATLNKAVFLM
jgi:hypothetical protein